MRLLADDDQRQADIAESLLTDSIVFIPNTVLLETEWGLRSRYRRNCEELLSFFRLLLDVDNVVLEDAGRLEKAINWYAMGADFADAMHLAACDQAMLHTFDRNFCKQARKLGMTPAIRILAED